MKTKVNTKRELLPDGMNFISDAMEAVECLAVLEDFDSKQDIAKFKRLSLKMRAFLITFTREKIEPIRKRKCVQDADRTDSPEEV